MFLLNSRSHLVSAASQGSKRKALHLKRRTFSRSYGTILPSSFTRVLSSALVFSTCPPVSVCGTVLDSLCLVTFPGSLASATSGCLRSLVFASQFIKCTDLPMHPPYSLKPEPPISGWPSLLRPHFAATKSTGILTRFPSITHFCLTLGADSPCVD